jgi:hypothetical protein
MRDGIAPQVEPPATSSEVHPSFGKPPLGVSTDMKELRPFAVGQGIGIWVGYSGLSPVMELGFVAQATMGTRNVKHKKYSLMGDSGRSMFVDKMPCYKAIERVGPVQFMRNAVSHCVGHDPARTGGGLESASSPAGVDEQVLNGS